MSDTEIIGLFPTPLMVARGAVPPALARAMIAQFAESQTESNVRTALLSHTQVSNPRAHGNYVAALEAILPKLRAFGEALLGESLSWAVKEIWINRMETGGAQKMHNHANSFVSGVVYLNGVDEGQSTVFHKNAAQSSFVMENANRRCALGPYNAPVFRAPAMAPGDMVLFPSYVMHEVPPNQGGERYTAAFNALPERLDSWGYVLNFR